MTPAEQLATEEQIYVVTMNLHRSTWNYFTTNPQGGGFGSNHCGSKTAALGRALRSIPDGARYALFTNENFNGFFTK